MRIGGREMGTIVEAAFKKQHYTAASNMLRVYARPIDAFGRYLLNLGKYPHIVLVNTPLDKIRLNVYSYHDILTINEIFCRLDYRSDDTEQVRGDVRAHRGQAGTVFLPA